MIREIILAAGLTALIAGCITQETITREIPKPVVILVESGYKIRPNAIMLEKGKQYPGVCFEDKSTATYYEKSMLYRKGDARILKLGKELEFFNCSEYDALYGKEFGNFRKLLADDFIEKWKSDYNERNPAY